MGEEKSRTNQRVHNKTTKQTCLCNRLEEGALEQLDHELEVARALEVAVGALHALELSERRLGICEQVGGGKEPERERIQIQKRF